MTDYKNTPEYHRRKADQAWEMAGLARADGDDKDSMKQTLEARKYERLARGLPPDKDDTCVFCDAGEPHEH